MRPRSRFSLAEHPGLGLRSRGGVCGGTLRDAQWLLRRSRGERRLHGPGGDKERDPPDEVILAMAGIGRLLPLELKETGLGGLADTPTGRRLAAQALGRLPRIELFLPFGYRNPHQVAPLRPRAVIVLHVGVAEEVLEDKPGVAGALGDAAVDHHVFIRGDARGLVKSLKFLKRFKGAVGVYRLGPGDVFGPRDVAGPQGSFLRVVGHVGELPRYSSGLRTSTRAPCPP